MEQKTLLEKILGRKEIHLFEHNEIAYRKLESFLQNNQKASVDHATGTGKSFIALKYLFNHKDKRILYLTPTYYIFQQLRDVHMPKLGIEKNDFSTFENIIYPNLLKMNMEKLAEEYDVFVLDEYHRCGAKLWGTKIKELISIIEKQYPDKKIVGLTATPTRYLDNERDMNEELFLGNSVSTITLGDAILEGLLQPPTYINTADAHIEYLEHVKNKLKRKVVYQEDMHGLGELLETAISKIKNSIRVDEAHNVNLPQKNGKYIVFCSTISEIKHNMEIIKEKFPGEKLTFYEVHSHQTKEINERELKNFRENNNSNSFVFVVDILNEGIHVDNIDGIFLMRKTTSPIIYFQQLGRLLSYSTKEKQLFVWDMVDNIKNHTIIHRLYQEVISEARKRLVTDEKNKRRYERILSNFRIIDNYNEVLSDIKEIELEIDNMSEEELLKRRVARFVEILCHQYKNVKTKIPKHIQTSQLFRAYDDLYKKYKYITLEQFIRLKQAQITLPNEINISIEAFEEKLQGFNNLYEKELSEQLKVYKKFKKYCEELGRVPSILSKDAEERDCAYLTSTIMPKCDKKIREMYKTLISEKETGFNLNYYFQINDVEYETFIKGLEYCLENDIVVNKNIYTIFTQMYYQEDLRKKYKLDKYLGKLKYKYNNRGNEKIVFIEQVYEDEKTSLDLYSQRLNKLKKYGLESIDEKEIEEFVKKYVKELLDFIKLKKRLPNSNEESEYAKYNAFRPFIKKFGYENYIEQKINDNRIMEQDSFIAQIIEFVHNNNGDFPSDRVLDEEEIKLAKKMKANAKILQYYQVKLLELQKMIRFENNDNWFNEYIEFMKINKRYPIIQSDEERTLISRFVRNESRLTKEERKILKTVTLEIGEAELIRRTFLERRKVRSK